MGGFETTLQKASIDRLDQLDGEWAQDIPSAHTDYAVYAPMYDAEHDDLTFDKSFWAQMVGAFRSVADVGCGTGRVTKTLLDAAADTSVVGFEPVPEMLERARRRCAEHSNVEFRTSPMQALDARPREFDLVCCTYGSFSHLLHPLEQRLALESIRKATQTGGTLIIDVPFLAAEVGAVQPLRWTHDVKLGDSLYHVYWQGKYDAKWGVWEFLQLFESDQTGSSTTSGRSYRIRTLTKGFTLSELVLLLSSSGFAIDNVYGDYARSNFTTKSDRIIIEAIADTTVKG